MTAARTTSPFHGQAQQGIPQLGPVSSAFNTILPMKGGRQRPARDVPGRRDRRAAQDMTGLNVANHLGSLASCHLPLCLSACHSSFLCQCCVTACHSLALKFFVVGGLGGHRNIQNTLVLAIAHAVPPFLPHLRRV